MSAKRMKYDREFREGAVRIVNETNKPIAAVARDLGVNEGTLGNWVARDREARQGTEGLSKGDIEELKRLRGENAALRMERDVLKRSVVPMAGLAAGTLPRASVGRSPGRAMGQRAHHPRQPGGIRRCVGGAALRWWPRYLDGDLGGVRWRQQRAAWSRRAQPAPPPHSS